MSRLWHDCPCCHGTGVLQVFEPDAELEHDDGGAQAVTCCHCQGTGKIEAEADE